MSKRTGIIIAFVLALLAIGGFILYWIYGRDEGCDPNNPGFTKSGKLSDKCVKKVQNPASAGTPPPSGSSGWIPEYFPLKKSMWGTKVTALQRALGFPEGTCSTCADGRFGTRTEDALFAKTGKREISEPEYNNLLKPVVPPAPPAAQGGLNFSQLKSALGSLAKPFDGGVQIDIPGQNKIFSTSFYNNGRFFFGAKDQPSVTLKKGTYKDGGRDFIVDGDGTVYTYCDATDCSRKNHILANIQKLIEASE